MSDESLSDEVLKKAASEIARRRANVRWQNTSKEERSQVAKDLNAKRWGPQKKRAAKKAARRTTQKGGKT
jgi:hypothetical protein